MNWLRRLSAQSTIRIRNGQATDSSGKILQWKLSAIAETLKNADVSQAEIWISSKGVITCSRNIPTHLHQRLRNIIV